MAIMHAGERPSGKDRTGSLSAFVFAVAAVAMLGAVAAAGRIARDRAAAELGARAAAAQSLAGASLASVIEKQRLIPMVLARDPEVQALLEAPAGNPRNRLDAKLAAIADEAASSVLYVVGADGVAVAASNDNGPDSFVGSNYGFRIYFIAAMKHGAAQQYALGTVSNRPGLYLSHRVEGLDGPLGVVVVKVEFGDLEARWRSSGLVVQVTDANGVVLATTNPVWRFGATRPLTNPAAERAALQIGDAELPPVPLEGSGDEMATLDGRDYVPASGSVGAAAPGWNLSVFLPAEPALSIAARSAQLTTLLAGLLLGLALYAALRRRRWALARQAALAAMNTELERRVASRTEELNRSNTALAGEIAERAAAETRARALRDDLAQANRLSILGQVAAGVAHEINQPVAAIRAYAETGARLIDAGQMGDARENFGEIAGITGRVGAITQSLRGFARRGKGELRPIEVEAAIDGALSLLAGRIRDAGVAILREPHAPGVAVIAGRIRLEQILVNLLQNALDALAGLSDPTITIGIAAGPDSVAITIRDTGAGIPPDLRNQLFMPFTTTKAKGLGLGLVISGDLAREFGGALRLEPDTPGGAAGTAFTLDLPRAP
ncbi:MAG: sensor histidine kinase [Rhodobacteraceae bacterium]|nr:sensor histidine kinase [Paracoccaceae bacterium]